MKKLFFCLAVVGLCLAAASPSEAIPPTPNPTPACSQICWAAFVSNPYTSCSHNGTIMTCHYYMNQY